MTTLPLTTTFSAPASCFSTITLRQDGALVLGDSSDCVPRGAQISERTYAFSPALSCPSSYTKALNSFTTIGTATEFRAICCPVPDGIPALSGLSFYYNFLTSPDAWFTTLGCSMNYLHSYTFDVLANGTSSTLNPSFQGGINAHSVQIAWQASDLSTTPTSTSLYPTPAQPTSGNSFTGVVIQTPSNLPSSSLAPSFSSNSGSDLSTGSKVAIGILAPFAALSMFLAAILLVKYRHRRGLRSHQEYLNGQKQQILDGPGIYVGGADTEKR